MKGEASADNERHQARTGLYVTGLAFTFIIKGAGAALLDRVKLAMEIIDKSFIRAPKSYIIQSLLAVLALAIVLYFVEFLTHAAIVAALGASTFIVFAMPHSITARSRALIGGHVIGLVSGTICYFAFLTGPLGRIATQWEFTTLFVYSLAVGLSIFLMALTNSEHPPAAGTALGIVAHEWSHSIIIFIILAAISLAIIRRLLRGRLRDLF